MPTIEGSINSPGNSHTIDSLYNKYNLGGLLEGFQLTADKQRTLIEKLNEFSQLSNTDTKKLIKEIHNKMKHLSLPHNKTIKGGRGGRGGRGSRGRGSGAGRSMATGANRGRSSSKKNDNSETKREAEHRRRQDAKRNWQDKKTEAFFEGPFVAIDERVEGRYNKTPGYINAEDRTATVKTMHKLLDAYKNQNTQQFVYKEGDPNFVHPQSINPYFNMSLPDASIYNEPGGKMNVEKHIDLFVFDPHTHLVKMHLDEPGLAQQLMVGLYLLAWVGLLGKGARMFGII